MVWHGYVFYIYREVRRRVLVNIKVSWIQLCVKVCVSVMELMLVIVMP